MFLTSQFDGASAFYTNPKLELGVRKWRRDTVPMTQESNHLNAPVAT